MKIRIRLRGGKYATSLPDTHRKLAQTASALTTPAAFAAYALGCWSVAADLRWTGEFAISRGIFSHWQVWIALGVAINATGFTLGRAARNRRLHDGDAPAS